MQSAILKDARFFQIIFQLLFLAYGLCYLHWSADGWLYATYFTACIVTQFLCEIIRANKRTAAGSVTWQSSFSRSIPSVVITTFGLVLLLKTNSFFVAAVSGFVAVVSKFTIRVNGKHVFNPSALGIVAAVYLGGSAWISPGQWGSGAVILFAVICLGLIVVTKVQKLDVSLAFLITYAGLTFVRQVIFLGWPFDFFAQSLSTGSLLLFSFFMITDPKTTPNHPVARIVWSMAVAFLAFYLSTFQFINGAPVVVLVCMQPVVPAIDYFFKAKRFNWVYKNSADRQHQKAFLFLSK